ncbi:hypothetical protein MP228_004972 [Amoeboaphelidium protococcarum]|nr:hypothetical protein MP228_004972 [Amoeboaphelidium protococcarum]
MLYSPADCCCDCSCFAAVGLLSEYDIVGHHVHPIPQHPIVSDNGYVLTSSVLLMNHGKRLLARLTECAPVNAPRCLSLFFNLLLIGVHVRRLTSGRCYSFREYKTFMISVLLCIALAVVFKRLMTLVGAVENRPFDLQQLCAIRTLQRHLSHCPTKACEDCLQCTCQCGVLAPRGMLKTEALQHNYLIVQLNVPYVSYSAAATTPLCLQKRMRLQSIRKSQSYELRQLVGRFCSALLKDCVQQSSSLSLQQSQCPILCRCLILVASPKSYLKITSHPLLSVASRFSVYSSGYTPYT